LYICTEVGANSFDTCILTTKIRLATQAALHAPQQALKRTGVTGKGPRQHGDAPGADP
jgi:hypothetical protein